MTRATIFALAMAVGVAVTAPVADRPPAAPLTPEQAPSGSLVRGGMLRTVLVMELPPLPPSWRTGIDRIADAVEGAESSHGRDKLMWRADPRGPQGPMQVTHLAAIDVGGGNRFDLEENRQLGRAYLARMYERYGNWRDTLLAYNWGPGNLDLWIRAGRPEDWLSAGMSSYVRRVLSESEAEDVPPESSLGNGNIVQTIATPERVEPPPRGAVREETIADPALRRKIAANNALAARLRLFLDATAPVRPGNAGYATPTVEWLKSTEIDPEKLNAADLPSRERLRRAGAKMLFAVTNEVSRRPGYGNFKLAKAPAAAEPDIASSRLIASLLVTKLEDANTTLALIDAHRRAGGSQLRPADAARTRR